MMKDQMKMTKVYNEHPEMFTIRMKKEGGFLGIGASEVPAEEMTPFEKVVDASVKMGTVIGSIAQALQIFADQKAIGKDANGQDIIVGITDATMKLAQNSITNIYTHDDGLQCHQCALRIAAWRYES